MPLQIVPLRDVHLEEAATLATDCYRAERAQLPSLPSRRQDPSVILSALRDLAGQVRGAVALQGGRLVGYLVGRLLPVFCYSLVRHADERVAWAHDARAEEDLW